MLFLPFHHLTSLVFQLLQPSPPDTPSTPQTGMVQFQDDILPNTLFFQAGKMTLNETTHLPGFCGLFLGLLL